MDFSACAKNAFEVAIDIAAKAGASIDLVSVTHLPHLHAEMVGAASIVQPLLSEYHKMIDDRYEELTRSTDLKDVRVQIHKYNAPLHDAIYSCTVQQGSDVIITGTKSQHDWLVNVLGSNSMDMIDRSKVPVIVIPEEAKNVKFNRLGVAIDYADFDDTAILEPLRDFAILNESSLCFLNVTTKHHKLFVYDDIKVRISNYFNDVKQSYHTFTDNRSLTEILMEAIDDLKLDMLFMLPKNHSVLQKMMKPSRTRSVAYRINNPLMTIHEKQP